MDERSKIRFKARFVIDFEIVGDGGRPAVLWVSSEYRRLKSEVDFRDLFKAVAEDLYGATSSRSVEVSCTDVVSEYDERDFIACRIKRQFDHLLEHLPDELKESVETIFLEGYLLNSFDFGAEVGSLSRAEFISTALTELKSRLRARTSKGMKGRPQSRASLSFTNEKIHFAEVCLAALKALESKKLKLTKTNLADQVAGTLIDAAMVEDREKSLRNQMKKYRLSMKQLVRLHRGEQSMDNLIDEEVISIIDRLVSC